MSASGSRRLVAAAGLALLWMGDYAGGGFSAHAAQRLQCGDHGADRLSAVR